MEFGIWNLEFGIWNLEFGIWNLEFGIWNLEFGILPYKFASPILAEAVAPKILGKPLAIGRDDLSVFVSDLYRPLVGITIGFFKLFLIFNLKTKL